MRTRWYKDAVVYQIYPRSFCDSDGDGIGDLRGIISKLDYLQELGVDAVWLSPIYASPNEDNGYDISDYRSIMPEFGTMDDFKEMVAGLHARGIRLIMDLVANHTSDEHEWFRQSRSSVDNPYRDYYIWRKGKGKNGKRPPNNWTSNFLGPAWEYDAQTQEYYLHLFARKQPDLNWDNPKVRREIADICNYWFELGVDGFRCDVITYVSKTPGLPDACDVPLRGLKYYAIGPNYHAYMHELYLNSWSKYDSMTVGEAAGVSCDDAPSCIDEAREELDSIFGFEHVNFCDRFCMVIPRKLNLPKFKRVLARWQAMPKTCQPTLFLENHDQSRSLPRFVGDYGALRKEAAKSLAISMMFQRGTPYIYQGQEIGMTNCAFGDDEYRDIMSINALKAVTKYAPLCKGIVRNVLAHAARDHARTPMQWNASHGAGFTDGAPWMKINPNHTEIHVEESMRDPDGIFGFYRDLLRYRKGNDLVIEGDFVLEYPKDKRLFVYRRTLGARQLLVIANYTNRKVKFRLPAACVDQPSALVLSSYRDTAPTAGDCVLRPYEAAVYEIGKST